MRPRRVLDEALNKLRRRNRPAITAADVFDVGVLAVDQFVVGLVQRHTPDFFADQLARRAQFGRQLVIVAKKTRILFTQRYHDRTRQRREVDDQAWLEALLRVPQYIGEHEAAFGIGVQHFDSLPRHRRDNVARSLGIARRHVLDEADQPDRINSRLASRQRQHQSGNASGTAHVALHVFHAGCRFHGNAAGIEHHAFADKAHRLGALRLGTVPLHDRDARRPHAAHGDCEKRAHLQLLQRRNVQDFDIDAGFGQLLDAVGKLDRTQNVGRLIDQFARQHDAVGNRAA